jgi:hypothetical protein
LLSYILQAFPSYKLCAFGGYVNLFGDGRDHRHPRIAWITPGFESLRRIVDPNF